jgi:hypothetical protein
MVVIQDINTTKSKNRLLSISQNFTWSSVSICVLNTDDGYRQCTICNRDRSYGVIMLEAFLKYKSSLDLNREGGDYDAVKRKYKESIKRPNPEA